MTYNEFKTAYADAFKRMMSYTTKQVGAGIYAEKMAALADAYPDFETRFEAEMEVQA
jgi:hypothetical protein